MCHLANKYEDIVNLQGAEAYCVGTCTACYVWLCLEPWAHAHYFRQGRGGTRPSSLRRYAGEVDDVTVAHFGVGYPTFQGHSRSLEPTHIDPPSMTSY